MIVDASALLAILLREPERNRFRELVAKDLEPVMSPVNYVEAAVRADSMGIAEGNGLDRLVDTLGIGIATLTPEQAKLARNAYGKYGKGRHPAKLNLGDCFAYALAKARNEPLLFKGTDFRQTDVEAVL